MVWFVGCAENFIFVTLQCRLGGSCAVAKLAPTRPQGAVFEVWSQVMVVEALLSMETDLQQIWSGLANGLWRKS